MPDYVITHRTTYRYASPVIQSHHLLHLSPREVLHQRIKSHAIKVTPHSEHRSERPDYFGNPCVHLVIDTDHRELDITSRSEITVETQAVPDLEHGVAWERVSNRDLPDNREFNWSTLEFAAPSRNAPVTTKIRAFADQFTERGIPVHLLAARMMQHIFKTFKFDNTATDVSTPVDDVLEKKAGVCQDFAHLQIAALRSLGLPARYVSGYIRTIPPEGEKKLEGTDASHAWLSVWDPINGWVDFDPTNNLMNSADHITICYGRDYTDVSPISGVLLGGGAHTVSVGVDVRPVA